MNKNFDVLINSYLENKIGIDDSFINAGLSQGLQENIRQLQLDDLMQTANIGNQTEKDSKQKIRSDKIYWLDKSHQNIFEKEFLLQIENFIGYLNETCYTGINGYEFHYAVYEEGSFYKRHKDQFRNNSERKYSMINYLNENWLEADGGQLLVYPNETTQSITPNSGKTVFFKSDEMEHEVSVANRSRMSVTGWLKSS